MNLRLYSKDRLRITSDSEGQNFIDVSGSEWDLATQISLFPSFHEIEIREKRGIVQVFLFKDAESKQEFDFGFYADAKVVFHNPKGNYVIPEIALPLTK